MKKNFDIRLNPEKPSMETMEGHKNFESLMQQFHKVPVKPALSPMHKLLIGAGAAAAALAGVLLYQSLQKNNDYESREAAYFASLDFVKPPIEGIAAEFASFSVEASSGGVFEYPNGTRLTVPPAAFIYDDGQPVSGNFDLQYREMNDIIDIFLSGIPMEYDSAGVEYYLESGGMIEIKATQHDRRLELAPGKQINVEMVSVVNADSPDELPAGYNIYFLDHQSRQWVYKAANKMTPAPTSSDEPGNADSQNSGSPLVAAKATQTNSRSFAVEKEKAGAAPVDYNEDGVGPARPATASWDDYVFELNLEELFKDWSRGRKSNDPYYQELKELYTAYENMMWRVSPNSSVGVDRLEKEFQRVDNLRLSKINGREYELTLEKDSSNVVVVVEPVLLEDAEETAVADYARHVADMKRKKAPKPRDVPGNAVADLADEKLKELRSKTASVRKVTSENYSWGFKEPVRVVNEFAISNMGIWNVDRPLIIVEREQLLAEKFIDKTGKSYARTTLYLADNQRNTVRRFVAEAGAVIDITLNSKNVMWLVTEDNKVAVFRPEQFEQLDVDASSYTFIMEHLPTDITSGRELRKLLLM
jgi:hypothetical protein